MRPVQIGTRQVGGQAPCFVIAEVGVNHNGDPGLARELIDAAADAGADCVKFQTFSADEFVNSAEESYTYRSQGQEVTESMLAMFRRLELARPEFGALFDRARDRGITPLSTPTDRAAVDLLQEAGALAFKVGSDDLVHTPLLDYIARKARPVIISAGMADAADIARAIDTIRAGGNDQIVLLHCVSRYPTPPEEANLLKLGALRERFAVPVGFSDHTRGITAAIGAVALGACVIEKHFTLDRHLAGPDHEFSCDPPELRQLVAAVREMETCLGSAALVPTRSEREMAKLCRRSIVAGRDIASGHRLIEEDLAFRRPGTGLMPFEASSILGRSAARAVPAGTMLAPEMFT